MDDTQASYTPDAGTEAGPCFCGVCGTQMVERRGLCGPRGFAAALGNIKSTYDSFDCPHIKEPWHLQVVAIREKIHSTPSARLVAIMREEVDEILTTRQPTLDRS